MRHMLRRVRAILLPLAAIATALLAASRQSAPAGPETLDGIPPQAKPAANTGDARSAIVRTALDFTRAMCEGDVETLRRTAWVNDESPAGFAFEFGGDFERSIAAVEGFLDFFAARVRFDKVAGQRFGVESRRLHPPMPFTDELRASIENADCVMDERSPGEGAPVIGSAARLYIAGDSAPMVLRYVPGPGQQPRWRVVIDLTEDLQEGMMDNRRRSGLRPDERLEMLRRIKNLYAEAADSIERGGLSTVRDVEARLISGLRDAVKAPVRHRRWEY
jgi:hypothetical protein